MFGNAIILALREIRRNVLRSTLTILGIVIGVGAVITMVTIGEGATAAGASGHSKARHRICSRCFAARRFGGGGGGARSPLPPFSHGRCRSDQERNQRACARWRRPSAPAPRRSTEIPTGRRGVEGTDDQYISSA